VGPGLHKAEGAGSGQHLLIGATFLLACPNLQDPVDTAGGGITVAQDGFGADVSSAEAVSGAQGCRGRPQAGLLPWHLLLHPGVSGHQWNRCPPEHCALKHCPMHASSHMLMLLGSAARGLICGAVGGHQSC
jgi:hypothetical protein